MLAKRLQRDFKYFESNLWSPNVEAHFEDLTRMFQARLIRAAATLKLTHHLT